MVLADVVKDYSQTIMLSEQEAGELTLETLFAPLCQRARAELTAQSLREDDITLHPALDMRYAGQSYELRVPVWDLEGPTGDCIEAFHDVHQQRYTYANRDGQVEIVNLRLKAVGEMAKPRFQEQAPGGLDPKAAQVGYKLVYFAAADSPRAARPMPAALYERAGLVPGNVIVGPAILFQLDTTSVVPPGWAATVDGWGNLVVEWSGT
jgi:N-methylhydantoinase A